MKKVLQAKARKYFVKCNECPTATKLVLTPFQAEWFRKHNADITIYNTKHAVVMKYVSYTARFSKDDKI